MEYASAELDRAIADFYRQWTDCSPFVEAHTSGSTGKPKKILLPKADMKVSALATCRRFGLGPGSTLHLCLSTGYIAGKMILVRSYVSGARVLAEPASNRPLRDDPLSDIDLTAIVPSQIEGLLASPYIGRVRNIIVGGAAMTEAQERVLTASGISSFASYGMTETCSHVALRPVGETYYEAMPGISFSTDSRGCLVIDAPEYSFGRIVTNDIVEIVTPTTFRWAGRYDNVINSGGIKIFPEEIEAALRRYIPSHIDFYISSRKSEKWGEELVIIIAPAEGRTRIDESDDCIMEICKCSLPSVKCPKGVIRVAALPRTANGKLKR